METMTSQEYRELMGRKPSKYRNRKTPVDGIRFDSQAEAARWVELKRMVMNGEITNLERQPLFTLQARAKVRGERIRAITYRGDFVYTRASDNQRVVEDVKGYQTDVFRIKWKMVKVQNPTIEFVMVNAR